MGANEIMELEAQHDDNNDPLFPGEGEVEEGDDTPSEEAVDPGQLEGVKAAQKPAAKKDHEPPPDSPRFKEIYYKAKENERQLKDVLKTTAEKDAVLEELRKHNAELAQAIKGLQTSQEDGKAATEKAGLTSTIESLKAQRKAALADEDHATAYEINDQIEDLRDKLRVLELSPSKNVPGKSEDKKDIDINKLVDEAVAKKEQQAAVSTFYSEAPWFNPKSDKYDPLMAAAADKVDELIAKDPEWSSKPILDQFREVKRRVEERFGVKSQPGQKAGGRLGATIPNVGGVESGGGGFKGKATLSEAQRKAARNLFPDDPKAEEYYAEQLIAMKKGR